MHSPRLAGRPAITLLAAALAACSIPAGPLNGATDEWTHRYPLAASGVLRIANTNGQVDVEAGEGPGSDAVEVRAERIARAVNDAGARDLLPRIMIKEDIQPAAVSIETEKMSGIMLGASFEVRYHVRAPKNVSIQVSTTSGRINLIGLAGTVQASATNGAVTGKDLSGPVDIQTTNGAVSVVMASVERDKIHIQTTNGGVSLTVPDSAKADVSGTVTNGVVSVSAGHFEASEQSRKRVQGRLNGGGAPIELSATNGAVRFATLSQSDRQPLPTEEWRAVPPPPPR